jgi:hypothetical protein
VENIVKKKGMKHVHISDVIYFVILEAVYLVLLKFLYHVFVEKKNKEFNVRILKNKNLLVKIYAENY